MLTNKIPKLSANVDFQATLNSNAIKRVESINYLGIIFDEKLNWSCHVKQVSTQLTKCNGILYCLRAITSKKKPSVCFFTVLVLIVCNTALVYGALLRKPIYVILFDKTILYEPSLAAKNAFT